MVEGTFDNGLPTIPISLAWKDHYAFLRVVLDTGFTGDIHITEDIARELGLPITGYSMATLANGTSLKIPYALGIVAMEKMGCAVEVHISNGVPLVGIGFLSKFGYKAIVDCKYKKVHLQKA